MVRPEATLCGWGDVEIQELASFLAYAFTQLVRLVRLFTQLVTECRSAIHWLSVECRSAIRWLSVECRSAIQLVLSPGKRDISGVHALSFGHLDHIGRLDSEGTSFDFYTHDPSVCCDQYAASSGQLVALWTTGGRHPGVFLALRVSWWCSSSSCSRYWLLFSGSLL